MMHRDNFVDGMVFQDDDDPTETVIFNMRSWVEVIRGIIVHYANRTEAEADSLMAAAPVINKPVNNYIAVISRSHELEYHWAMLIAYGEQYWSTQGISPEPPEDYLEWETNYRTEHKLAQESFVFSE
ncbi:MAG TPA: hypothetical protein VJ889_22560 [Pseudomonas sp.]|nr:hypothetical protein [Pseudomonas sp.]